MRAMLLTLAEDLVFMDTFKPEDFWSRTDKPRATRAELIATADSGN